MLSDPRPWDHLIYLFGPLFSKINNGLCHQTTRAETIFHGASNRFFVRLFLLVVQCVGEYNINTISISKSCFVLQLLCTSHFRKHFSNADSEANNSLMDILCGKRVAGEEESRGKFTGKVQKLDCSVGEKALNVSTCHETLLRDFKS